MAAATISLPFITSQEGEKIYSVDEDPLLLLNKITVAYGATESGKTVAIKSLLNRLRDHCSICWVVSKTHKNNKAFSGFTPEVCILSDLTLEWLEKFQQRQNDAVELYTAANNPLVLEALLNRCGDANAIAQLREIKGKGAEYIEACKYRLNSEADIEKVIQTTNEYIVWLCKPVLKKHRLRLLTIPNLTKEERLSLLYLYFNPNAILIIDDFASLLNQWKNKPVIKDMFYASRHGNMTILVTCQSDKNLSPDIRQAAHNVLITTTEAANSYFGTKTNGFSPEFTQHALNITKTIFTREDNEPESAIHRKLFYVRKTKKFYWVIGNTNSKCMLGGKAIWDLQKKIPINDNFVTSNNKLARLL
jgi:hypothetical protein